jgi:hypothetical protein
MEMRGYVAPRKDHMPYELLKGAERDEYMKGGDVKTYYIEPQKIVPSFNLNGYEKINLKKETKTKFLVTVTDRNIHASPRLGQIVGKNKNMTPYGNGNDVVLVPDSSGTVKIATYKTRTYINCKSFAQYIIRTFNLPKNGGKLNVQYVDGAIIFTKGA